MKMGVSNLCFDHAVDQEERFHQVEILNRDSTLSCANDGFFERHPPANQLAIVFVLKTELHVARNSVHSQVGCSVAGNCAMRCVSFKY